MSQGLCGFIIILEVGVLENIISVSKSISRLRAVNWLTYESQARTQAFDF